jgi:pimeloyl-ACP methyl ester carboxylesterase
MRLPPDMGNGAHPGDGAGAVSAGLGIAETSETSETSAGSGAAETAEISAGAGTTETSDTFADSDISGISDTSAASAAAAGSRSSVGAAGYGSCGSPPVLPTSPAAAVGYDEFSLFRQNADEAGLAWTGPPAVERVAVDRPEGQVSALRWGHGDPELVLLHGGAQNAHTWDTVALALDRPLLAIDLPGHGHSSWWPGSAYHPGRLADTVAAVVARLAPNAAAVVGMSLGGLTSFVLAARHPDLVRRVAVVDVTPGTDRRKSAAITNFVQGPESFASFEEILERTVAHNPTRSQPSLRRGILHNARSRPDGRWVWRYDRLRMSAAGEPMDFSPLWDDVSAVRAPLMLLRGSLSPVVDDDDVAEVLRRQPTARVEVVEGAGHSIQGDRPLELAALLTDFVR